MTHHRQEPAVLLELVAQLQERLHGVRSGRLLGHGWSAVGARKREGAGRGRLLPLLLIVVTSFVGEASATEALSSVSERGC
jgi:hypothetical protein